jgi:hypothetical protein
MRRRVSGVRGINLLVAGALAILALLVGPEAVSGAGGDAITPSTATETLAPGGTTTESQTLHLDALPPEADILLAFDTTGSMGEAIANARTDASSIVTRIQSSIPGARFAVADFRDYSFFPFGIAGDYPWRRAQDFTTGGTAIQTAVNNISACTNGCGFDLPEAYNRAFYEAALSPGDAAWSATDDLSWASDAPRFMIVLGDSYGHDPNQAADFGSAVPPGGTTSTPNCPATSPIDPGRDEIVGTADDLGTLPSLSQLKATHTNVSFVTYNPGAGPDNNVVCQSVLAAFTGGSEVTHDAGTTGLGDQIVSLINQAAARIDQVTFSVSKVSGPAVDNPSSWFSFDPPTLGPATAPVNIPYDTTVSVPAGQALGQYVFRITAVADGAPRASQDVTVNVVGDAISDVHLAVDETSLPAGVAVAPFSKIPASRIPFFTGATTSSTPYGSTPYGSTPFGSTPFGSTPYGSTPWGSTPYGSTPYGSTPYGSTPFGSTPWGSTPFGSTPFGSTGEIAPTGVLGSLPFGSTPFGSTTFDQVLLSQIPLLNPADHATWPDVLAGTPLAGQPLSSLSLSDVLNNETARGRLYALPMKDISFASTLWQGVPVGAILLGQLKVSDVPVPPSIRSQTGQTTWQGVISSSGGCASCISDSNTFFGIAAAGVLGDAHIGSIPFGSTPFGSTPYGSTPYGSTPGAAITLNSMNVAGTRLAAVQLSSINPLSDIVSCSPASAFSCDGKTLGDAAAARAIKATATLGMLFNDLPASDPARQMTLDEIVGAVLPFTAYPWEQIPVQGLQDVAGTGKNAHYHVTFTLVCSSTSSFKVTVQLPTGFFPVQGSSAFTFGSSTVSVENPALVVAAGKPTVATWTSPIGACTGAAGGTQPVRLDFTAFTGLTLGDQPSTASVSAVGLTREAPEHAPVLVTQNHEPNDDPSTAPTISDNALIVGHVASAGDKEYFRFPLSGVPVNSRLIAFLKVPSGTDLDLTLNGPSLAPVQSSPFGSTPLGTTPVPDQAPGTDNADTVPQANTLSDIPFGSTPWGSTPFGSTAAANISQNRGDAPEQAALVVHAASNGMATIGVTGYNGAFSNEPYVLRLEVLPPPPLPPCSARTGFDDKNQIGPLPSPNSLPIATKTLFLVDRQRLARLYGSAEANKIVASAGAGGAVGANLATLAARSEVKGAVLSVDGNGSVRSAYAAFDANPCSPDAANGVVRSINDLVARYRSALPNLHNIVLLGTDTAIPMYRQPDPTVLSPELDEAPDLAFTTSNLTAGNSLYAAAAQNNVLTDGAYGAFTRITWLDHDLPLPQISVARLVETPTDINAQVSKYLSLNGTLSPQRSLTTGYDFLADSADATKAALSASPRLPSITADSLISPMGATTGLWTKSDVDSAFYTLSPIPDIGALFGHYNHFAFKPAGPENVTDIATQVVTATGDAVGKDFGRHVIFSVGCHGGLNVGDELGRATAGANVAPQYQDWAQTYAQGGIAAFVANTGFGYGDTDSIAASEKLFDSFAENLNKGSSAIGDNWFTALTNYYLGASIYSAYDEKVMLEATFYGLPFYHFATPPTPADTSSMTATPSGSIDIGSTSVTGLGAGATPTPGQGGTQYWKGPAGTLAIPYRPIQPLATKDVTIAGKKARDIFVTALTTHDVDDPSPTQGSPVVNAFKNEPSKKFADSFWPASFTALQRAPVFGSGERDMAVVTLGQYRPDQRKERLVSSIRFDVTYSTSSDVTRPLISQVGAVTGTSGTTIFVRASDNSGSLREVVALWNDGTGVWHVERNLVQQAPGLYVRTVSGNVGEVAAEAMDPAGNVAQSWNKAASFRPAPPDTSGPRIVIDTPLPGQVFTLNQQVKPVFSCSDSGGVATCTGAPLVNGNLDTTTAGDHTFTVTATDLAGNTATRSVTYTVRFTFVGFKPPVDNPPVLNIALAGSTIPVKWSLLDASGNAVSDLSAVTAVSVEPIACPNAKTDTIETTVPNGLAGLTYDVAGQQFVYNWTTDKGWAGLCRRFVVQFADAPNGVATRYADFQFK